MTSGVELVTIDPVAATVISDRILRKHGTPPKHAALQAQLLVEADLRGRPSHGLQRLPLLVSRIERGLLVADAEPTVSWTSDAFARVDGHDGFGVVAARAAVRALAERSARTGVALAAIRASSHIGMLAPYLEDICKRGLVGIVLTTSEALVHPTGGREALIGTNPIGIGVPAGDDPFLLDMATSAISAGEIIAHGDRGMELPAGRAVDADGAPTVDPMRAREGAISPFGGAKGYGLGLAIELVVALLSDTALGRDVLGTLDAEHRATKGDVICVIDPVAAGIEQGARRLADYLDHLRASPTAPGVDRVLVPGDRMRSERTRRMEHGLTYPTALWDALETLDRKTDD